MLMHFLKVNRAREVREIRLPKGNERLLFVGVDPKESDAERDLGDRRLLARGRVSGLA